MHPKNLSTEDFTYALPNDRIALYPVSPRNSSQLLVYNQGSISKDIYQNIGHHLPKKSVLIFNDTRVIKSRILFTKDTGAVIEVFCLEPYGNLADYEEIFQKRKSVYWKCFVGKANKWKEKHLKKNLYIRDSSLELKAELIERLPEACVVKFSWDSDSFTFREIINAAGTTPLPPYIKRAANKDDETHYQTVYSAHEGSVAAPTAGLHFTKEIVNELQQKNIQTLFTTLHVGAGTFKPVKAETMEGHYMHAEWMHIELSFLEQLKKSLKQPIIAVGTTATRTLESIYWMGNKILHKRDIDFVSLKISQWEVYETRQKHSPTAAIQALINWMKEQGLHELMIETEIIIAPSYTFKISKGLITNFHQPQSTLLLLVAALLGEEWRKVYDYALKNNFRFLSYGDGSLLLPLIK